MDSQPSLDLGFLFCFSHHRTLLGMGGGKGGGAVGHLPRPGWARTVPTRSSWTLQLAP